MTESAPVGQQRQSVTVSALAHTKIILHAVQNPHAQIHGILVGRYRKPTTSGATPILQIAEAFPVCHSAPTKPLLDMAFRLAEAYCKGSSIAYDNDKEEEDSSSSSSTQIVGWYTANERLDDVQLSPSALRVMGTIAAAATQQGESLPANAEPCLFLVNNNKLGEMMLGGEEGALEAYGRDARKQWQNPVPSSHFALADGSCALAKAACSIKDKKSVRLFDFEDHLHGGAEAIKDSDWLSNPTVSAFVQKS